MQFTLHTSFDTLTPSADEWNNLLRESPSDSPFLRFEYLRVWWENRGGGEWAQAVLAVVTADEDGKLIGVAPLFQTVNRDNESALLLLGSIEISDFLDVIVRPSDLTPFLSGLLDLFASHPALSGSALLDWYNVLEASPTLGALEAESTKRGWTFNSEVHQPAPSITLPADLDAYLAGIDKKQRHEMRRKMRRASESATPPTWYIVTDESALESEMEALFAMMAQDSKKEIFLTAVMRAQMQSIARAAFQNGWLWLAFLEVDGVKAAAAFNFDYGNRLWGYNSGVNHTFNALSPGWIPLAHTLKWAIDHGRTEFDFMRGAEDYKYRFGARDRLVMRAVVRRG